MGDAHGALPHCETLLANAPDDQYLIALETTAWRLLGDERYRRRCDYQTLVVPFELDAPPPWPDVAGFFADLNKLLNPAAAAPAPAKPAPRREGPPLPKRK